MIKSGEEILADIDITLDQLIRNAEVLRDASVKVISENEVESLQKMQESLLSHILLMDTLLSKKKKQELLQKKAAQQIQQKIATFSRLNLKLIKSVASKFTVKSKRRKKHKARKA